MIIVSACLAGIKCKYDGKDNLMPEIQQMVLKGEAIPLCPEQIGGLSTPRIPCEIIKKGNSIKVIGENQKDYTKQFKIGSIKVADIAKILECEIAILKANSPSCGYGKIYDGTFSGRKIMGNGLTAELLASKGIKILNENNYHSTLHTQE
ncbi:DUF523 domain-containing protein [Ancylomarina longa]|uniref:DUF523 domain-containing protein n=1 Tax=Ancylomarina longa TaxID=2487017 RepID=A0A434AZK2_9BACT|nr:DUF523 domain-containing protein [Ancylomarina longa]RUT79976.1 DUF523 domain-containing protein [Ancylomarina longa]